MTQTKLRRRARALKVVEKHTRTKDRLSLMDIVEDSLQRRACLAAELAVIDAQLGKVYDRLAQDIPVRPEAPPLPLALQTPIAAARPAAARPPAKRASQARRVGDGTTSLRERVLDLVHTMGPVTQRGIAEALSAPKEAVKYQLKQLQIAGDVVGTGATASRVYTLAKRSKAAPAPTPQTDTAVSARRRVVDGVEYESVWTGAKSDPSLLGDRETRGVA